MIGSLLDGLSMMQSAMNDFGSLICRRNSLIEVTAVITRWLRSVTLRPFLYVETVVRNGATSYEYNLYIKVPILPV